MEALGNAQAVAQGGSIIFDVTELDSVGNNITINPEGTVFTINRTGLYHIEWSLNLAASAPGSPPAVVGIIENGEAASGATSFVEGVLSSGTIIQVDTVPFTLRLYNFNGAIALENPAEWLNSAASIRIVRFADGPST